MTDFSTQFQNYQQLVNDQLKQVFSHPSNLSAQAAEYSLLAPGKRLRPILAIATYESLTKHNATPAIAQLVCSLEMAHTFSLIHDDLPALDNDTLRRGLPTCHAKFNEATAILAGDLLLNQAFLNLTAAKIASDTLLRLQQVLSQATQTLIFGEQNDLLGETVPFDQQQLQQMFADKTGALFGASFAFGAILAGLPSAQVWPFLEIGEDLGLAFQIQDDVLDVTGDQATLGKNIGSDENAHKSTWVKLYGLERAQQDYHRYYTQVEQKLRPLLPEKSTSPAQQFLLDLLQFLQRRDH